MMARKPLNETEREQKRLFDEELRKHSLDALKNIWKIANSAMDAKVRLQANQWLVEKAYGKDYQLFREEQEQQTNEMRVNFIVKQTKQVDATKVEKDLREIMDDDETFADNTEWDDWKGEDIYIP